MPARVKIGTPKAHKAWRASGRGIIFMATGRTVAVIHSDVGQNFEKAPLELISCRPEKETIHDSVSGMRPTCDPAAEMHVALVAFDPQGPQPIGAGGWNHALLPRPERQTG